MDKKLKVGILGAVAAAGVVTNVAVDPQELLRSQEALSSHEEQAAPARAEDAITVTQSVSLSAMDALRARIIALPVAVKAVVFLPLWLIGELPVLLFTALSSALGPVWGGLVGFAAQALLLVGVFCVVYKLLFPNRSVRELFKKKNLTSLLLGAAGVTGLNWLAAQIWPRFGFWRAVAMVVIGVAVLGVLWYRICQKLPGPKKEQTTRYELEY